MAGPNSLSQKRPSQGRTDQSTVWRLAVVAIKPQLRSKMPQTEAQVSALPPAEAPRRETRWHRAFPARLPRACGRWRRTLAGPANKPSRCAFASCWFGVTALAGEGQNWQANGQGGGAPDRLKPELRTRNSRMHPYATNNPEPANAAQAPAPLGANLRSAPAPVPCSVIPENRALLARFLEP